MFGKSDVEPEFLSLLLNGVDKIEVWDSESLFCVVDEHSTVKKFSQAFEVVKPDEMMFMSMRTTERLVLFSDDEAILSVDSFTDSWVRCSCWKSDAIIKNPMLWAQWFESIGLMSVPRYFESRNNRMKKSEKYSSVKSKKCNVTHDD